MLKTAFLTAAALAAVATSVSKVNYEGGSVNIGGKPVTEVALQLRETETGVVLASKDSVEPLGGLVEVTLEGGRIVTIEPGLRIKRVADGYELTTHGRRPIMLRHEAGELQVPSPVTISATESGWNIASENKNDELQGKPLRAALASRVDDSRVASRKSGEEATEWAGAGGTPPAGTRLKRRLDVRRVTFYDPFPSAEPTSEPSVKRAADVSPSGF